MTRLHLFELGDMPWFPRAWHQYTTDYLSFVQRLSRKSAAAYLAPLRRLLAHSPERRVIDLCAGGAGPWMALQDQLAGDGEAAVDIVLTDRSPNLPAFERARALSHGRIDFFAEPVDASAVPETLAGVRTIFNAFHHFRPDLARAVLADAARQGRPIGIFEMIGRTVPHLATSPLIPLAVLLATPFVRPFRLGRLLWTYVFPVVPLVTLWDGVVSMLRVYSVSELTELTRGLDYPGYQWEVDELQIGPVALPYLLGYPTA